MHYSDRIPPMQYPVTEATTRTWFADMQRAGLLFHPEDDPATILTRESSYTGTNTYLFTLPECYAINQIMEDIAAAGITDPCALALEATT